MWRTSNGGANWSQASAQIFNRPVSSIAVSPVNPDKVLAGTIGGHISRTTAGTTSNASTVWSSTQPRFGWVSSVAFDPSNDNVVYATYSNFNAPSSNDKHVYKSVNGGATWTGIDGSGSTKIPDTPVHCILVDPNNSSRLYVGTALGVFVSVDGGSSWARENTGFANAPTETLAFDTARGVTNLYAFTHGGAPGACPPQARASRANS
jgi:photosystem II stability/assembly factor-like uncharacterized protein